MKEHIPAPHQVQIPVGHQTLEGDLTLLHRAKGIVLFVHGSGSSRMSPRNQFVAQQLNEAGLSTLLFDLLTSEEEAVDNVTDEYRFDIDFLAKRLIEVTEWIQKYPDAQGLAIGYFGASTGAAAALVAGAHFREEIQAIVSRGGRPDMAEASLKDVTAPTLLIVGGRDDLVIRLNESAFQDLKCQKELLIIPGATHLFEERGTLEEVAEAAGKWFSQHFLQKP